MKKLMMFVLLAALVFSLAACGSSPAESVPAEAPEISGLPNPMVSYDSPEEINEIVGSRLCTPGVMGVTDQAYFVIETADGKMAEEQFTVAGLKYSFRCAPVSDHDISGLWISENSTAFESMKISDELQYAEDASFKAARWFTIDGQYVLSVMDEGKMDKDTFLAIAEELRSGTQPGMSENELTAYYADLAGQYADTVSQRASAEVTANGSEGITIVVSWGNSAFETEQWKMEARLTEDGLISYPGEEHSVFTTDANGNTTQIIEDADPVPGWFEFVDGQLLWTGANEEQCRICVFEKIPAAQ